jgi:hypothetical protein
LQRQRLANNSQAISLLDAAQINRWARIPNRDQHVLGARLDLDFDAYLTAVWRYCMLHGIFHYWL